MPISGGERESEREEEVVEQVCGSRLDRWSSTCATDSRPFFPPLMPYLVNSSGHTGRQKRLKVHSTRTLGHRLAIPRLSAHPRPLDGDVLCGSLPIHACLQWCCANSEQLCVRISVGDFCARTAAFENDATFQLSREFTKGSSSSLFSS